MTYHIADCDDEAEQAERLRSIAEAWAEKCGVTCRTDCFPSAEALLFAYADDAGFDILLLDVEMKEMSGIRLAKRLRADGCRAEIAFITSHFEFVTEGYEVDALHYLVKPVAAEKLCEVLSIRRLSSFPVRARRESSMNPRSCMRNPSCTTL